MRSLIKFAVLLFSILSALNACSQEKGVQRFDRYSAETRQTYALFVSLPNTYAENDTTRYPVLYVMDGDFMFPVLHSMYQVLNETYAVKDLIIVGVGYHAATIMGSMRHRTPDYTPTKDTAFEQMFRRELQIELTTGNAAQFLSALKKDIFPFVESKFRTNERGFAGHSFGALFGSYTLFTEPGLFQRYLLSSISLPWDNKHILGLEQAYHQAGQKTLNAHLFVSIGSEEKGDDMLPLNRAFVAALRAHQYTGLKLEDRVLQNETHPSAFLTAFNQGLRVLYPNNRD